MNFCRDNDLCHLELIPAVWNSNRRRMSLRGEVLSIASSGLQTWLDESLISDHISRKEGSKLLTVRIYNTLTQKEDELRGRGLDPRHINMYVCGPTVYDSSHIGHGRSYIFFDTLKRTLLLDGYSVKHLQNFSDVDEKIDRRAKHEGVSSGQVSKKYAYAFIKDMESLNVLPPDSYLWVSDELEMMHRVTRSFIKRGLVYEAGDNLYFRAEKGGGFGSLLHDSLDNLICGNEADTFPFVKENKEDFTIWLGKFDDAKPELSGGRPSWNLECFSMVHSAFGCELDIQGGGNDLVFPHHEVASLLSKAYCRVEFAKYYVHNGFVTLKQGKMSKSENNFIATRTLLSEFSPESLRLYLLSTHFRKNIEFNYDSLRKWETTASLLRRRCEGMIPDDPAERLVRREEASVAGPLWHEFMEALRGDMDTDRASSLLRGASARQDAFSGSEGKTDFRLMCAALGLFGFVAAQDN